MKVDHYLEEEADDHADEAIDSSSPPPGLDKLTTACEIPDTSATAAAAAASFASRRARGEGLAPLGTPHERGGRVPSAPRPLRPVAGILPLPPDREQRPLRESDRDGVEEGATAREDEEGGGDGEEDAAIFGSASPRGEAPLPPPGL